MIDSTHIIIPTPAGDFIAYLSAKGVQALAPCRKVHPQQIRRGVGGKGNPHGRMLVRQLAEYFQGKRRFFEIPLDLQGSDFQRKVWAALCKIPYGRTVSYQEIARRIGSPKAARVVGSANGRNPVCILIPCHRVIAADGSIGGYSGGLDLKRQLLSLESGHRDQ